MYFLSPGLSGISFGTLVVFVGLKGFVLTAYDFLPLAFVVFVFVGLSNVLLTDLYYFPEFVGLKSFLLTAMDFCLWDLVV